MRHEILRMLENNSRIDLHDLAIMLGTDESVVLEEIEKMVKKKGAEHIEFICMKDEHHMHFYGKLGYYASERIALMGKHF